MADFEYITAQHIRNSSLGYELIPGGRTAQIYKEGERCMTFEVEFGATPSDQTCITVWPGAFTKWDDGAAADVKEQLRIEKNVRSAIEFDGLAFLIWDHEKQIYIDHTA
jgi:hypothetical protein